MDTEYVQVLRDNLGNDWEEACATLMTEMRMYELECLRRYNYFKITYLVIL